MLSILIVLKIHALRNYLLVFLQPSKLSSSMPPWYVCAYDNFPSIFTLTVGSCGTGIGDSILILILGNHRFQNFWKGTHVKIELEQIVPKE